MQQNEKQPIESEADQQDRKARLAESKQVKESNKPAHEADATSRVGHVKFDDAIQSLKNATRETRCSIADTMDDSAKHILNLNRIRNETLESILRAMATEITRIASTVIDDYYREPNSQTLKAELESLKTRFDNHVGRSGPTLEHDDHTRSTCCEHSSDCAVNNEPAMPAEPCDCKVDPHPDDYIIWCQEKAAQAWCKPSTKHKVMDVDLCAAFAEVLDETLFETPIAQPGYWRKKYKDVSAESMAWMQRHAKLTDALLKIQACRYRLNAHGLEEIVERALRNDCVSPKLRDDEK